MPKRKILLLCALLMSAGAATAQQSNDAKSSFDEFRKGLLNNYSSFREGILADYAKFLEGVWVEYNGFRGQERDETPKPETPPVAPATPPAPVADAPRPAVKPAPEAPVADEVPETPRNTPTPPPAPAVKPAPATAKPFTFDYKGIEMQIPEIDLRLMESASTPADFAAQWRSLDAEPASAQLVSELSQLARKLNFNDYLTYDLATAYTMARYPQTSPSVRTALVHYIMTHLGYDVRLGTNGSGQALLMFPTEQTIYGQMYLKFGGEKYYVFTDPATRLSTDDMRIYTCELPAEASKAARLNLRLKPLNIPYEPKPYTVSHGGLEIHGETNSKLYPLLYKYPQMPIADYAQSELMPELRSSVVSQLKEQLKDKSTDEAVDALLQFVQSGFRYATDGDFHGFEKPYFFEETLFYPKCDCEDRVIFYTYLLWNVLGVENQLIAYPGHESASVSLPGRTKGDAYTYDGKTFLISDPTYIGAKTGMCMPDFRTTSPEIDHTYR